VENGGPGPVTQKGPSISTPAQKLVPLAEVIRAQKAAEDRNVLPPAGAAQAEKQPVAADQAAEVSHSSWAEVAANGLHWLSK